LVGVADYTTHGLAPPEISGWIQVNSSFEPLGRMRDPSREAREPLAGAGQIFVLPRRPRLPFAAFAAGLQ
jgi:hypothetical protein